VKQDISGCYGFLRADELTVEPTLAGGNGEEEAVDPSNNLAYCKGIGARS
jgi:hypothetical protein